MAGEFGIKFKLIIDKFVDEDIVSRVGKGKVKVLVLGFPGFGDAGECWKRLCLGFDANSIWARTDKFSFLLLLKFLILIKEKLHFMDLMEGILEFFFDVIFVA